MVAIGNFSLLDIIERATSHEVAKSHIALLCFYSVIGLVSILGNGLLLFAILRTRRVSEKYFLLNLVLTDLLITVICIPGTCHKFFSNLWLLGDLLCRLSNAAMVSTAAAAIFNHTAMILERSLGVNASRIATNSRDTRATSLKMICAVWLLAIAYGSPVAVLTSVSDLSFLLLFPASLNVSNLPLVCINSISSPIASVVYDAVGMLLLYIVPLCVIIAAYVRIVRTVREVNSQLVKFNNSVTNRSKKIVRLAVTMAVMFAVSWLPLHLSMQVKNLDILISSVSNRSVVFYSADSKFSVLQDVFNCLGLSNCAANPVYLFLSCPNFRKTLARACRGGGGRGAGSGVVGGGVGSASIRGGRPSLNRCSSAQCSSGRRPCGEASITCCESQL